MPPKRCHRIVSFVAATALLLTVTAPAYAHAGHTLPPAAATPTPTPEPAEEEPAADEAATDAAGEYEWTILLYQNADDPVLEGDIFRDLNEAEVVGSSDTVAIVSQLDRYEGAFDGDGDWTGTRRYFLTQDDDLATINSEELEDLGEIDSGAPETLQEFITWGITNFPAQKYALILSDHGAGWLGGWNDNAPDEGSSLTINEIDQAINAALQDTGVEQLEFIGFDACLMSQAEALSGIAPYARYAAASQEVEPAMGWAYASFLSQLQEDPAAFTGAELANAIVASYIVDDLTIQDPDARAEYLKNNFGVEEDYPPAEVGEAASRNVTLTAVDLEQMPPFMDALNAFAYALTGVDPAAVARARTYAQSFESVFGDEVPAPYIDLGNFAKLVQEFAPSEELDQAVSDLEDASMAMILSEMSGPDKPGATGLSIFFPVPELLQAVGTSDSEISYTGYASRFAGASLWDEFLVFHYTNTDFDPDLADPALVSVEDGPSADIEEHSTPLLEAAADVTTPGVETEITIAPIEVSSEEIASDETVLLGTQITGEDIGYIYVEAARYDEESDSWSIEDRDFVAAEDTQEIDGVQYPVWTEDDLADFIYEWSPTVYTLSDGETEAFALFDPAVYGVDTTDTLYTVRGIYQLQGEEAERGAILRFDGDLNLLDIIGFNNADFTGAPRAITPQPGDTFTVLEEWVEADEDGNEVINDYPGETLTFGDTPFVATAYEGYPGEYSIGITVTDLNGNATTEYANVTVTESESE